MKDYLYSISKVSERTGVPSVTLRAWERRYGLLKPERTDSGHRLYCEADIDTIHKIISFIAKGVAVSKVRGLLDLEITIVAEGTAKGVWQDYRQQMILAIENFNQRLLDSIYNEVLSLYPIEIVTKQLLLPLMKLLGQRWEVTYKGSVAEEHFFSTYMRNKLGARFHHLMTHTRGDKLLFAGLPGQRHEFALLLFAIHLMNHGYDVVYLGPDTPVQDVFIAASAIGAAAIVIDGAINVKIEKQLSCAIKSYALPVFWHGRIESNTILPKIKQLKNDFTQNYEVIKQYLK